MFAINFLNDYFGCKRLKNYPKQCVTAFSNYIAYIINREIELSNSLDDNSIQSMVKNGVFGNGSGLDYGEHLIKIDLWYKYYKD